ncbi:MAG: PcfB family protein [Adlercreutzia equolifaciens]
MDASSEAAEQIVRMTLEGTEVALRITGAGAKNAAAMLLAAAASNEKTKGRARLSAMLKSGRELRVFPIRFDDLKGFAKEARRYGIAYAVVKQRGRRIRRSSGADRGREQGEPHRGEARPVPHERRRPRSARSRARGIGTMGARTPRRRRAHPNKLRRSSMICWHRRATATPPLSASPGGKPSVRAYIREKTALRKGW